MSSSLSNENQEKFLRQAIALSESAVKHGNHPFGASLVSKDEQVILTAENTVTTSNNDTTRHAELNLISMATQKFDRDTLEQCTLYTSCEPCSMCAGAILWSGVRRVVYSVSNESLGKYAGFDGLASCRQILSAPKFTVVGPILEEEGIPIHQIYWNQAKE